MPLSTRTNFCYFILPIIVYIITIVFILRVIRAPKAVIIGNSYLGILNNILALVCLHGRGIGLSLIPFVEGAGEVLDFQLCVTGRCGHGYRQGGGDEEGRRHAQHKQDRYPAFCMVSFHYAISSFFFLKRSIFKCQEAVRF